MEATECIYTMYHPVIESYLVRLPDRVTLHALQQWGAAFMQELEGQAGPVGLLFDTHTHNFESIDCLRWLKAFFTETLAAESSIDRVAFVQPLAYRQPEVVSASEAYFATAQDAQAWLASTATDRR